MDTVKEQRLDPRRRDAHPERLEIGGEVFIRYDLMAQELGLTVRSLDRGDREGAPFVLIGGIKYRPKKRHDNFILNSIQERKPQLRRHKPRHRT